MVLNLTGIHLLYENAACFTEIKDRLCSQNPKMRVYIFHDSKQISWGIEMKYWA